MNNFIMKYLSQFDLEVIVVSILNKVLSLLLLFCVFYIIKKITKASVKRLLVPSLKVSTQEIGRQKTISRLVESILNYLLYFILIYCILSVLGLPVSSLLAGAGIAGVAIGLGAQGFLSDLVNGFFILIERQFNVGDVVKLTNGPITISGTIISMGIRTTQIRDADGTLHFIPNRNILVVSNHSRGDMRAQVDIPLKFNTDLEQVYRVVEEVNSREVTRFDQITGVTILGPQNTPSGQFVFRVNLFVANGQQTKVYHQFFCFYQEALRQAGIDLPAVSR
ncbi:MULTISPECIES: mechanosensitive ion channel family protein [Streptococcus]|uniref:Mechanosensitive ion channel family protein n=2 Tax=Streptococcus ruminantium TaxID=1917441 RepID=A0A2Z5TN01_9STRE|nr:MULTISPECIES: mechanosensitive ion channel family protein [Streptococcus]MDQ8760010.1 mechanosensitive ion channel family protein [Streptococcus ruminantium]MDQ8765910.1 mechanosensitive ion channel family protein [Streptococcus ruminantium]MDQ8769231.1 mechanosensitive ion channel family protein [Streptococcus ruminantium]MDQ8775146.1 mechanosensitive ion channel family protein [Streptococcus ruminantium]MDQ8794539.1 mechanosensitive ion channel family protein [Streptococcus ruminantium]